MSFRYDFVALCIMLHSLQSTGHAQGLQHPTKQNPSKSFASTAGGDRAPVFSSPLLFRQKDGLKVLALNAIFAAFIFSPDNSS